MSLDNMRDLYQQVILERYKKPRHKGKTDPADRYQKGHNPSYGDTIELILKINGDRLSSIPCSIDSAVLIPFNRNWWAL